MTPRVVFDTSTVLSALLFANGRLAWLREHWRQGACTPLLSAATAAELTRVFAYPKFHLTPKDRDELLADYIPFCELVSSIQPCAVQCRDANDQPFLDLAHTAHADALVSSDKDLLALIGKTHFSIETPDEYWRRVNATN